MNEGLSDADEVVRALRIERDSDGCAAALMATNCIFGIKSYIVKESSNEIESTQQNVYGKIRKTGRLPYVLQ